jgi:hypothetical protein
MKLDTRHKPIEKRIQTFERRFGKKHLFFAYHAAFPLALTPDLLQCLWANFRCNTRGEVLDIPWVVTNDFLLSGLCEEVGEELYEMDAEIRDLLLERLQGEENFQQKRIQELSSFLLAYADPLLNNSDRDLRDFGQAQRWTALAYSQPEKTARELALELSKTYQDEKNREDILRISEIVETLKNPLSEFEQLLNYSRGMVDLVRGNTEIALNYFEKLGNSDNIVEISGVNCLISQYSGIEEVQQDIDKPWIAINVLHLLIFIICTLIGGFGLLIYNQIFSIQSQSYINSPKPLPKISLKTPEIPNNLELPKTPISELPRLNENKDFLSSTIPDTPEPSPQIPEFTNDLELSNIPTLELPQLSENRGSLNFTLPDSLESLPQISDFPNNIELPKISISDLLQPNENQDSVNFNVPDNPESSSQNPELTNTNEENNETTPSPNSIIVSETPVQNPNEETQDSLSTPNQNSTEISGLFILGRQGECRSMKQETPLYSANSIRAITGIYLNENDVVQLLENHRRGQRLIAVFDSQRNISGYVETSELKVCPPIIATQPQTTFPTTPFNTTPIPFSLPLNLNQCEIIRETNLYESPGFDSQRGELLEVGENLEVDPKRAATANNFQWIYVSNAFGNSGWVIVDSVGCR